MGPKFLKLCGRVLYHQVDIEAYEESCLATLEFTVERHLRGKWACAHCQRVVQTPVPAHIIDKGIPTAGLLAHVLVAKFLDHLPLYRQERIFERAGLAIARSTLAQWVVSAARSCSRWCMRCWRLPCTSG